MHQTVCSVQNSSSSKMLKIDPKKETYMKHVCIWSRKHYSVMKQHMKFELEVSLDRTINSLWGEHGISCSTSVTMTEHNF